MAARRALVRRPCPCCLSLCKSVATNLCHCRRRYTALLDCLGALNGQRACVNIERSQTDKVKLRESQASMFKGREKTHLSAFMLWLRANRANSSFHKFICSVSSPSLVHDVSICVLVGAMFAVHVSQSEAEVEQSISIWLTVADAELRLCGIHGVVYLPHDRPSFVGRSAQPETGTSGPEITTVLVLRKRQRSGV